MQEAHERHAIALVGDAHARQLDRVLARLAQLHGIPLLVQGGPAGMQAVRRPQACRPGIQPTCRFSLVVGELRARVGARFKRPFIRDSYHMTAPLLFIS